MYVTDSTSDSGFGRSFLCVPASPEIPYQAPAGFVLQGAGQQSRLAYWRERFFRPIICHPPLLKSPARVLSVQRRGFPAAGEVAQTWPETRDRTRAFHPAAKIAESCQAVNNFLLTIFPGRSLWPFLWGRRGVLAAGTSAVQVSSSIFCRRLFFNGLTALFGP